MLLEETTEDVRDPWTVLFQSGLRLDFPEELAPALLDQITPERVIRGEASDE